jgi:signal transduction histidine kinase
MSVIAVITGLLGAVFFGAVMTLFLTRLAWDIRKLAARALDIVSGYRGPAVEVTRQDEVGDLMEAVNRMQSVLRHWEQQVEISREQRFHKEKMAAIGSLAAAVAHEINNPIAAIAGIAQSLKETGRKVNTSDAGADPYDMILEQSKRITAISRQIAELTAPHPPEHELLDLNSLVRNTCSFIGYDKRFRRIELVLDLDTQIPAIDVVADHVTQVLMNLLINAADALEDPTERKPTIRVATQAAEGELLVTVTDNGKGMDSAVLARAFEESFTTKPPDKGRGLGLFLCKSLIEGGGNRIELESTPGAGTTARLRLTPPKGT